MNMWQVRWLIGMVGWRSARDRRGRRSAVVSRRRDRACMTGLVDRYLEALVRHDASGLPLNRDVKQLPYGTPSGWGE
jgi:hypothetical protein